MKKTMCLFIFLFLLNSYAVEKWSTKEIPTATTRSEDMSFKYKKKYNSKVNSSHNKVFETASNKLEAKQIQHESNEKIQRWECAYGEEKRILELKSKLHGCDAIYTKAGVSRSVAWQNSGINKCTEIISDIKNKLSNSGFDCETK